MKYKLLFIIMIVILAELCSAVSIDKTQPTEKIIKRMNELMNDLSNQGYNINRINDAILEAETALDKKNSTLFYEKVDEVQNLINLVYQLNARLKEIRSELDYYEKLNFSTNELNSLYSLLKQAEFEFDLGNYEQAELYLEDISGKFKKNSEHILNSLINELTEIGTLAELNDLKINKIIEFRDKLNSAKEDFDFSQFYALKNEFMLFTESFYYIININNHSLEAKKLEIPDKRFQDMLFESVFYFEQSQYSKVKDISENSGEIFETALKLKQDFPLIENEIIDLKSQKEDMSEIEYKYSQSKDEFEKANFEKSDELLDSVKNSIDEIKAKSLLFGAINREKLSFNIKEFIKKNWIAIGLLMVFIYIFFRFFYTRVMVIILKNKLNELTIKKSNLIELIKKLQERYYVKKTISKNSYEISLDAYQKKLIRITREIPLIKNRLSKLIRDKKKKN